MNERDNLQHTEQRTNEIHKQTKKWTTKYRHNSIKKKRNHDIHREITRSRKKELSNKQTTKGTKTERN